MTILQAIQEANTGAGAIKKLSFANLQEFNSFKDSFTFLEYPVNVVVPFTLRSQFLNGYVKDNVILQGWILTRINQDTNDWRSVQLEVDYINPMRLLAKKFVRTLLDSDIIDSQVEAVTVSIVPEYMFLDAHLFGVSYSLTLPVRSNVC